MAITINGITCQEIARKDGLREDIDLTAGPSARKGYLCDWNDRFTVAKGLLGYTASTLLRGVITLQYPMHYPEIQFIHCHHISIEPVGSPIQGQWQVAWPKCILWCDYARLPFLSNGQTMIDPKTPILYATQKLSMSSEYTTIPSTNLTFASTGNKLTDQHYAFRMPLMEYEIAYRQVPWLPDWNSFSSLVGTTNKDLFLTVPPGQCMFNGMNTTPSQNYDGTYTMDITLSFTIRMQPWDYSFDNIAGDWDQVVYGSTPMIARTDWSGLLLQYIAINAP